MVEIRDYMAENCILEAKYEKKIDELKKKLKQCRYKVQEANLKHQNMINQLAHDLRTPLTPIISFLQILEFDLKSEKLREQSEIALKNAKYLFELLQNILSISKDNFQMNLVLESTDLIEILKDIVESQKITFAKKRIKIITGLERIPKVKVDRVKIREAIENVLKNAYAYSPMGSKVFVELKREKGNALISVTDEGKGIKKENLENIFRDFFREDGARSAPHLGLGLSISKRIVEKHKGKIIVESKGEDKGSRFTIMLPLMKR